jgi:LAO/AO transport system kinase
MNLSSLQTSLKKGDHRALAKAITLVESNLAEDRKNASKLLDGLLPKIGKSVRIGISGAPGVGKSTFIESLGQKLLAQNKKLAILAIDPTSPKTSGSILGDKTRMEMLSRSNDVFIRPSPSGGHSGGVNRRTRESILLCEAAGFDWVIVETVGVGQSEIAVASMVDMFVMLQMPYAGDELQGIKKGILELAELIVITKADGENADAARRAQLEHERALSFLNTDANTRPAVLACSGLSGEGIDAIIENIEAFVGKAKSTKQFQKKRQAQLIDWFYGEIFYQIKDWFADKKARHEFVKKMESDVFRQKQLAPVAARKILSKLLKI